MKISKDGKDLVEEGCRFATRWYSLLKPHLSTDLSEADVLKALRVVGPNYEPSTSRSDKSTLKLAERVKSYLNRIQQEN